MRPEYLSKKLSAPIPTKDRGTLCAIQEGCEYMAAISKERQQRRHWQQVRELIDHGRARAIAVSSRAKVSLSRMWFFLPRGVMICYVGFPPQTAKRWPDSGHKLRNAGRVFATNRETRIFAAKYA